MRSFISAYFAKSLILALALSFVTTSLGQSQRRGVYGDWKVSSYFGERKIESIISLIPQREGKLQGTWISFFGSTELKDVSLNDNQLQFTYTRRGRNGESTSKFKGSITDGKLSGIMSGDNGDTEVTGKRAPRSSRAAGSWDMKIQIGDQERTGTLKFSNNDQGALTGKWTSERGTSDLDDVKYTRGELSFNRTIETQDGDWKISFKGNIRGNALTGTFSSDRGEAEATAERIGSAAIGTWNLSMSFNEREMNQRLRINGDMTGLYGSMPIEKVKLDGNNLSFEASSQFGDREFTWGFEGNLDGDALKGDLTMGENSLPVTGKKVVYNFGRSRR